VTVLKFDEVPACVLKLAHTLFEMNGPAPILGESAEHLARFGSQAGVDTNSLAAAMYWLSAHYSARVGKGSVLDADVSRKTAARLDEFGAALDALAAKADA
jgi:hypothetical protein